MNKILKNVLIIFGLLVAVVIIAGIIKFNFSDSDIIVSENTKEEEIDLLDDIYYEDIKLEVGMPRVVLKDVESKDANIYMLTPENLFDENRSNFLPEEIFFYNYTKDFKDELNSKNVSIRELIFRSPEYKGLRNTPSNTPNHPSIVSINDYGNIVWGPYSVEDKNIIFLRLTSSGEQAILSQWIEVEEGVYELDTFVRAYPTRTLWGDSISKMIEMTDNRFYLVNGTYSGDETYSHTVYDYGIWDAKNYQMEMFDREGAQYDTDKSYCFANLERQSISADDISDWLEYSDENVTFKYPPEFTVNLSRFSNDTRYTLDLTSSQEGFYAPVRVKVWLDKIQDNPASSSYYWLVSDEIYSDCKPNSSLQTLSDESIYFTKPNGEDGGVNINYFVRGMNNEAISVSTYDSDYSINAATNIIQTVRLTESSLIQECPSEMIVDRMPNVGPVEEDTSSYYIFNESRREIEEFDVEWVSQNCSVLETIVE